MAETVAEAKVEPVSWDEQQYKTALAHLERLDNQITTLRSAIPSMIQPLVRPNMTSKSQAFVEIKKAAVSTKSNLREFREDWQSERTREILERARESESRDADLGPAREVGVYGWVEAEAAAGEKGGEGETGREGE